ncbi:hypothetical protein [Methyloceanibacter sp. wino2]|uniref:hypothetical protein n=1 Tax=Methyloceanibacter sp. wino2 TaxID=2170729 RepID=UPI000D3E5B20|nr:hypothetical protein [Methyloceanibacter sp. wino2]
MEHLEDRTIGHFVWRGIVVVVSFCVGVGVALAVLFALGSVWMGDELRAIAIEDPQFRAFVLQDPVLQDPQVQRSVAMAFGAVVFIGTVGPRSPPCRPSPPPSSGRSRASARGCTTCWPGARRSPPFRSSPAQRPTRPRCPRATT